MTYKEQITNRLVAIRNDMFSGNNSKMGNAVGVDESRIRSYTKDNVKDRSMPPAEFIASLIENVEINPEWLLLGVGGMMKNKSCETNIISEPAEKYSKSEINKLIDTVASQQRTIEMLVGGNGNGKKSSVKGA